MERSSVIVGGRKVALWQQNPGSRTTILMLHGQRGSHRGLMDLAKYFSHRVILPDLPGIGESEPLLLPPTPDAYVRWIDDLVDSLHLTNYKILGHSYGSALSIIHSAIGFRLPDALICVAPAPMNRGKLGLLPTIYYEFGRWLPPPLRNYWVLSPLVNRLIANVLLQTTSVTRKRILIEQSQRELSAINPKIIIDQYLYSRKLEIESYAQAIHRPVLILAGSRDIIAPQNKMVHLTNVLPDGHIVVMSGQGHLAPLEDPSAVAAIVNQFLHEYQDRLDSGKS